ncbi:MAG: hypothetical protein IMY68_00990 [Bacteroidetes bacterium]|nr:hypothetical protein [Bacteroidota bacterium]
MILKDWSHTYNPIAIKTLLGILLFIISFLWFFFPGEYVLIANRDLNLFLITPGYLGSFLDRPGGLLEYAGSFLNQFYRFRVAGALVLSGVITSAYFVTGSMVVRISGKHELFVIGILAAVLMLGMHNYYPHQLSHTLGFILAMRLVVASPTEKIRRRRFLAITVPLIYLAIGGYVWFFGLLMMAEEIVRNRKIDFASGLLSAVYPAIIIFSGARLLFLDPLAELAVKPLPFGEEYGKSPWPYLFIGWMILGVVLARKPLRFLKMSPVLKIIARTMVCVLALLLVLHFSYKRKNGELFQIEKMALSQDWDELLAYTAKHPSTNLFGAYYTNLALANSGKLCSGLFQYPQTFGRRGLCFNWEAKAEILRRGSDFFWTVHFVNEAHHWAFESMIIDGFTRRNLIRLIQTELVRGNLRVAEKYVNLLGEAMFHKKIAMHYARFLDDREALHNDPELGPRLQLRMKQDFFSDGVDLERNLVSLLANNPSNIQANDYLMALLLLEKELDKIEAALPAYLEANGGILPPLLDESLLVYKITHREENQSPLKVSPATLQRFDAYTSILRQYRDQNEAARVLYPTYGSSFWFYLNFVSLPNL